MAMCGSFSYYTYRIFHGFNFHESLFAHENAKLIPCKNYQKLSDGNFAHVYALEGCIIFVYGTYDATNNDPHYIPDIY